MFKELVHNLIEQHLDEETCACVVARFQSVALGGSIFGAFKEWDENKHPRADDGKFSPTGSARPLMKKTEAQKWDKIGHSTPTSKELLQKRRELKKAQRSVEESRTDERRNIKRAEVVKLQREIAELERQTKHERRTALESDVSKRILKKQVKEFQDLEDEIDYMEERYADRKYDSPTQGEVVFPQTKRGQKDKQKYEDLKKRRDELKDEIEWDKVEDED